MFKHYRKTQITEMTDWYQGFDMTGVSITDVDRANGSPKLGDKIARNPANHEDRWLVAAAQHAASYEEVPQPTTTSYEDDSTSVLGTIAAIEVAQAIFSSSDPTPDTSFSTDTSIPYDSPAPDFVGGGGETGGGGAGGEW